MMRSLSFSLLAFTLSYIFVMPKMVHWGMTPPHHHSSLAGTEYGQSYGHGYGYGTGRDELGMGMGGMADLAVPEGMRSPHQVLMGLRSGHYTQPGAHMGAMSGSGRTDYGGVAFGLGGAGVTGMGGWADGTHGMGNAMRGLDSGAGAGFV